jgi:hypothetical protein
MNENPAAPSPGAPTPAPPPLSRNMISYLGWVVVVVVAVLIVVLITSDILFHRENPYNSVVTYLVLPGVLGGGVGLILLGVLVEWYRRHRREPGTYPTLPTIDLNLPWQRRRLMIGAVLLTLFFGGSAIGVYQSYHYTESPEFCGLVCHSVMKPEYEAYQHSPHARVLCTECHIGSGADWYVKSKMSGLRQVVAMVTQSYELPIKTPVHNLRPARDTCEQCHWPGKFTGSMEREIWHFSPDQSNTAMRYNLLMKVGGGEPEVGQGHGIHWHISSAVTVRYWPRDEQRLDIPWVEVTVADGAPRIFRSPDFAGQDPPETEIRTMDCIDCHNRPAHIYKSPRHLVDQSLAGGLLDASLPYVRRQAVRVLETRYASTDEALAAIDADFRAQYAARMQGEKGRELVESNIAWLQRLYQRNFFPEQKVDWRTYPNHLGHFEFPGCYRCHDDKHATATGETISNSCNLCHDMIDQAEGEAAYRAPTYHAAPFNHPRGLGDVWIGRNCTDCHGLEGEPLREVTHLSSGSHPPVR